MATKYVDIWATYNGDGTSSSAAASDGAAGAWNAIPFKTAPTYGSIAAGDTIIIRSKSGSNNATFAGGTSGNLTMYAYSTAPLTPVTWQLDDGTVWAGDSGTLTVTASTGSGGIIFKSCSRFVGTGTGGSQSIVFQENYNGTVATQFTIPENTFFWNCKFTSVYSGQSGSCMFANDAGPGSNVGDHWSRFRNCYFEMKKCQTGQGVITPASGTNQWEFQDCTFDLTVIAPLTSGYLIAPGRNVFLIRGGKIVGANPNWYVVKEPTATTTSPTFVECIKFDPGQAQLINPWSSTQSGSAVYYTYEDIPGGEKDSVENTPSHYTQWRANRNYPYLYGLLRDHTPWSYMVWPNTNLCNASHVAELVQLRKINTLPTASRTITVNFLLNTNSSAYTSPQKDQWWMEGLYVNNSGTVTYFSTYATGDMATSTAPWTPVNSSGYPYYGPCVYQPYQTQHTTSDQIATNTVVYLTLKTNKPSISTDDYYFVDPSIIIE